MQFHHRSVMLFVCLAILGSGCIKSRFTPRSSRGDPGQFTTGFLPEKGRQPPRPRPPASGRLYVLLVGCTRYDNLDKRFWLQGPGNDVILMQRLLQNWPGFSTRTLVALSEHEGAANRLRRPTRENIRREFAELARRAGSGDQVVILLAGHGSQQPDQPPYDEIDGLDEIFLPADVGAWDAGKKAVANAIIDDELHGWLKAVTDKDASVWVVIDACHSGTMTRSPTETPREIRPQDLGIPQAELLAAQQQAARRNRGVERSRDPRPEAKPAPFELPAKGALVAVYACRSTEPTVETLLPYDAVDKKRHGLFTFTLCQVLERADTPLSYKEAVQQVQAQYDLWGRTAPAPLVEGPDIDRAVLGSKQWPGRSSILLARDKQDGGLKIEAGALLGLTRDSILAVYPLAGSKDADRLLGHVRITQLDALQAKAVACEYNGVPAPAKLNKGRCEVVAVDYGDWRLKLAVAPEAKAERERLEKGLSALIRARPGLVEVVEDPARADWVAGLERGKVYLTSTRLAPRDPDDAEPSRFVGSVGEGEQLVSHLEKMCTTIVRVNALLALGNASEERSRGVGGIRTLERVPERVVVKTELIRYKNRLDKTGEVVPWKTGGRTLKAGDRIAFRLTNPGPLAVDVTLLFIDPGYGIHAFFPEGGRVEDNRLLPGATWTTPSGKVSGAPPGRDHLVVIAVKAGKQPVDLSGLAQPSIDRARSVSRGRFESRPGELLLGAFYEDKLRGGLKRCTIDNYSVSLISWETRPDR